jgi:hypothetical protein
MPGVTVDDFGRMVVDMDKTRAAVQKVIPPTTAESTTRGNTVLSEIDQIAKAINDYNAGFTRNGKEVVNLYLAYGSKPEDFKRVFAQIDAEKENGQKKVLDARFKMKEAMTPQEWKALFNQKG